MDTYGFITILIGFVLWFAVRNRSRAWWWLAGATIGVGAGIVLGALGAYLIVMSMLP